MNETISAGRIPIARHTLYGLLAPVPGVCFSGALATDLAYAVSPDMQWANFSAWLLFVGAGFAVLAMIAGVVDFARHRRFRRRPDWIQAIGSVVVLVLAVFNNFVHSRDAYISVVPMGLTLSLLTVLVMIGALMLGRATYRETAGGIR